MHEEKPVDLHTLTRNSTEDNKMVETLDISTLAVGSNVLIIGGRSMGKSTLLCDLLFKRRNNFTDGEALIGGRTRDSEVSYLPPHRVHLLMDNDCHFSTTSVWIGEEVGRKVLSSPELSSLLDGPSEVYITAQCMHCVPAAIRLKFDMTFILRHSANIRKLYDQYFTAFQSLADFRLEFDRLTAEFGCVCVDRERNVYAYRAEPHTPKFMIRASKL